MANLDVTPILKLYSKTVIGMPWNNPQARGPRGSCLSVLLMASLGKVLGSPT